MHTRRTLLISVALAGAALLFVGCTRTTTTAPSAADARNLADNDPFIGNADALVTIVEFSDFQCPACQYAEEVVRPVIDQYGPEEVRFVYRDFPLRSVHEFAQPAAEAAQCALDQGGNEAFWAYHATLFENQPNFTPDQLLGYADGILTTEQQGEFRTCVDERRTKTEVDVDFTDGRSAGVSATPTFFVNDEKVEGVSSAEEFKQLIDRKLAEARASL